MKWLKITTISTLLLLCVNIFLGYNIYTQYVNTCLIGDSEMKDTVLLLGRSGITVNESVTPRVKPDNKIYQCDFYSDAEQYYIMTASRLSGAEVSDSLTLHMINNGIKIINNDNGDAFEFYDSDIFAFMYAADGKIETYADIIPDSGLRVYGSEADNALEAVASKLLDGKRSAFDRSPYYSLSAESVYYASGMYILTVSENIDGRAIEGMTAVCAVKDGKLVYVRGNLIIGEPDESYSTVLYDQINVLFDERKYLEECDGEFPEGGSDYVITSVRCGYTVAWNTEGDKYYLVPAWRIEYNGEIAHIRSAIDGRLC